MVTISEALTIAVGHHQAGRLTEAEFIYRRVLDADPRQRDALHLLGVVLRRKGDLNSAMALIGQAVALDPAFAEARHNLGSACLEAGALPEAVKHFRNAVASKPDFASAHFSLGIALGRMERSVEAAIAFRRALVLRPDDVDASLNLGVSLRSTGRAGQAAAVYRRALMLAPAHAGALSFLGKLLGDEGGLDESPRLLRRVLALTPDNDDVALALGSFLVNAGRLDDAVEVLLPASRRTPRRLDLRLTLCHALVPRGFETAEEIPAARARYTAELESLAVEVLADPPAVDLTRAGAVQFLPYYLPYQGQDDRRLQALYGAMVHRIATARHPHLATPPRTPPLAQGERIRVGILSAFFCRHSNWKIPIRGWVEGLDRNRFALHAYMIGTRVDDATASARGMFGRFVEGQRSVAEWAETIRSDDLHVLIIPEVGMDALTLELAALPLVARQCASWGHPNTTGLPTIGHFLSSDLMEPPGAEEHYTERLVRLPNLSILYHDDYNQADEPKPIDFAAHGLRPDAFVYLCVQSLPKYLPQHDAVLARIARSVPQAQFVFLGTLPAAVNARTEGRLKRAFAKAGADPSAVVMLPALPTGAYLALQQKGDVFLDSIGWSGCNSTLEALNHDLPIVTIPGRFMRERHSAAILDMMGITDTVARDVDDYVAIAVRLATDREWRTEQSGLIRANRHRVHGDRTCTEALAAFLAEGLGDGGEATGTKND